MFSLDASRAHEFFGQYYPSEAQGHYQGLNMTNELFENAAFLTSLPFSSYENASLFVEAPHKIFDHETYSASSHSSLQHTSQDFPPSLLSSASGPSIRSACSSTIGSPYSTHAQTSTGQDTWALHQGLGFDPAIVNHEAFPREYIGAGVDPDFSLATNDKVHGSFVDPSLIEAPRTSYADVPAAYTEQSTYHTLPTYQTMSPSVSAASSPHNYIQYTAAPFSPSIQYNGMFPQFPQPGYMSRRPSISSYHSGQSPLSGSVDGDDDNENKGRCPFSECGRVFKDLKAHMLTHQLERPEKCPIVNCDYHQKGFARKYDKNRHTLTHYKGTMVCGFCPGSGSPAEKSFNRADVFKRHLTSVHGVEQAPPNSRKRSPTASTRKLDSYCEDATGKCSTCAATFVNAQDFYEHLDDCVLRVVQQEEPSEAINHHHLANISQDEEVKETMERNLVKTEDSFASIDDIEEEEDDDEDENDDDETALPLRLKTSKASAQSRAVRNGGITKPGRPRKVGLTYSKGGVPLIGRGRKKRKDYPPSWGMSADRMQMKKRVLCVYDGQRRLWKDDLMMHNEFEVRMSLPDGKSYVTDLDVETLKRAEAFHNATDEERGPWLPEQPVYDLGALMA